MASTLAPTGLTTPRQTCFPKYITIALQYLHLARLMGRAVSKMVLHWFRLHEDITKVHVTICFIT